MRIDLHTHSNRSDGTDSPAELIAVAIESGVDVLALTDHDTTAGWDEAAEAVRQHPGKIKLVPGAELSCTVREEREEMTADGAASESITVHLLAYLFNSHSAELAAEQLRLRKERRERLHAMAVRMAGDGFAIDPEALMASLPPDSPGGRPHLARALLEAGYVSSVSEAFDRYLGRVGRYYIPRTDTPVDRAIAMISAAGGVTVLAHPFAAARGPTVGPETVAELAAAGLTGIEVDHPDHDVATRAELRALARELDLIPTGSSDYHGLNKTIRLGQEATAPESFERLVSLGRGCEVIG